MAMTYEEALKQLEDIVSKVESDELDIDNLGKQLKKAQQLIKLCKDKLAKADEDINEVLKKD